MEGYTHVCTEVKKYGMWKSLEVLHTQNCYSEMPSLDRLLAVKVQIRDTKVQTILQS